MCRGGDDQRGSPARGSAELPKGEVEFQSGAPVGSSLPGRASQHGRAASGETTIGKLNAAEEAELEALHAKVWERTLNADGEAVYRHWTQVERDRVRVLQRRRDPAIRFAPSTEEIGRLFGLENRR